MKLLPARGALGALALAAALVALLVGIASLPWRAAPPPTPPRVVQAAACAGALRAGAASVPFELPAGVPIAGYTRRSYRSEGVREPVGAHALVLAVPGCKVAFVSAELLLVSEALEEAVLRETAGQGLSGLVLGATHTHAGPGGYRDDVFEWLATGRYDPRAFEAIVSAIARAIREADAALAPARASVARGDARTLAHSRSGGDTEGRLAVVRVDRPDGQDVAELVVFAAHATILGKENRRISGDWPGRFLAAGGRGTRLYFEGALGDQTVKGSSSTSPEDFAAALSALVAALPSGAAEAEPAIGYAAAEVTLPALAPGAVPSLLHRAARSVVGGVLRSTTTVEAVRIGDLVLVALPAESVASVAASWRASLPPGTEILSLSGGWVGYVESPERMAAGEGETHRTFFGPELAARLGEAARLAAERVAGAPGEPRPPAPTVPARGR